MIGAQRGPKVVTAFLFWFVPWAAGYVPGKMLRPLVPGVHVAALWEKLVIAGAAAAVLVYGLTAFKKLKPLLVDVLAAFITGIACGIIA